ncbi:hypothetical protein HNR42_000169 [Deinobacterium chartae]|uniref:Lipoprotein n=1 Tax=Deinobacterium chartae TaxID=521158 RepID=A0A841HTS7_9DEIO|nr:hypothetical protein [Deinobacterium chartae]MBB6096757.1 hypothetical protein [Deinobacterium chartae]
MKKLFLSLGLAALLSSCAVDVVVGPGSEGITVPKLTSNFVTNSGESVICDDAYTTLTYSFEYAGNLLGWQETFRGSRSGEQRSRYVTNYSTGGYVRFSYDFPPGSAPLSLPSPNLSASSAASLRPQSIVPTPIAELGRTSVSIAANFPSGTAPARSNSLRVLDCF